MKLPACRILLFAAFALLVCPAHAASLSFAEAKALADRDEAGLARVQSAALLASQGETVDRIVAQCSWLAGPGGMPPFVVVAELDAAGKVIATWRDGQSEFAACFEKKLRVRSLFVPPHAPFHTSFEMSMSKEH